MPAMTTRRSRRVPVVAAVLATAVLVAGCAGFRVERDGRRTGDALCDLKGATSAQEAQQALADAQKWFDQAVKITGRPVSRDVKDVQNNLNDLVKHATNGNDALKQQDIAAIRRNVQQVIDTTSGHTQRYYQGVDEGLSNCSD